MFYSKEVGRKNSVLEKFKSRKIESIEAFKLRKKKISKYSLNQENVNHNVANSICNISQFAKKNQNRLSMNNNFISLNLSNYFYEKMIPNSFKNKEALKQYQYENQKKKELEPHKGLEIFHRVVKQVKNKIEQSQLPNNQRRLLEKYRQQPHLKKGKHHYSTSLMSFLQKPKFSIKKYDNLAKPRSQSVQRNINTEQCQFRQTCMSSFGIRKSKNRSASQSYLHRMEKIIKSCQKLQTDKSIKHSLKMFQNFSKQMDDKLIKKSLGLKKKVLSLSGLDF